MGFGASAVGEAGRGRGDDRAHEGYEDLRGWWLIAERLVRTNRIVVPTPAFHDYPGLGERVEDLAVQ